MLRKRCCPPRLLRQHCGRTLKDAEERKLAQCLIPCACLTTPALPVPAVPAVPIAARSAGARFRPTYIPDAADKIDAEGIDKFETAAHDTAVAQQQVTYGLHLRARPQVRHRRGGVGRGGVKVGGVGSMWSGAEWS